jgi:hypothetical protein
MPRLVGEPQQGPPHGRRDQHHHRDHRRHAKPNQQRRVQRISERELVPLRRDREVREDEDHSHVADLSVKLQQRVLAKRRRHRLEASHEDELKAHHRESDEPERDREVGPEPMVGLARADHGEHERGHHHAQIRRHREHRPGRKRHGTALPVVTAGYVICERGRCRTESGQHAPVRAPDEGSAGRRDRSEHRTFAVAGSRPLLHRRRRGTAAAGCRFG